MGQSGRREMDALNKDPLSHLSISSQSSSGRRARSPPRAVQQSSGGRMDGCRSRWMAGQRSTNPSPSVLTPQSLSHLVMHTETSVGRQTGTEFRLVWRNREVLLSPRN